MSMGTPSSETTRFVRGVERKTGERQLPRVGRGVAWASLIVILLITLFPFFWALRTAWSNNDALFSSGQSLLPVETTASNFERVLGLEPITAGGATFDFFRVLRNTVVVATIITIGQVTFSAMAAYAFSRLTWRGRDTVFLIFLTGLMIPPIFTLIPNFILIKNLGWLNTYQGIIAPFFLMTPFAVFFLRQFFLGINRSLEEAATLDGAGHWRIFRSIILPMSVAPMVTLGILTYITAWNEYLWPLVVGRAEEVRVLTVALGEFTTQQPGTSPDWAGLMAATILAAAPIIVAFMFVGRRVVDAIQFSGIK